MNRLTILAPIALLLIACVTQPAEAYRVKRHATQSGGCAFTNEGRQVCGGSVTDRAAIPDAAGTRTRLARRALKVALFGSLEFIGFRPLVAVERLIGTFQVSHGRWGAIRRHKVESAS